MHLASPLRQIALASLACLALATPARAIVDGYYNIDEGGFESLRVTNETIGAIPFYNEGIYGQRTIIANVEAGHIWGGHEAFDRSAFLYLPDSPALSIHGTAIVGDDAALGELDTHATMVAGAMAGTGYLPDQDAFSVFNMGISPLATLWSGAIATSFYIPQGEEDAHLRGSFSTSYGAFLQPYKTFFNGTLGQKADVINSSWGFEDRSGTDLFTRTVDGLARQNTSVTLVVAAGNSGEGSVNGVGSGYNAISVGSISGERGSHGLFEPSDFSSHGPADFYNPQTDETLANVRATVHLAAPGEDYALPAYLGATGSYADREEPDPLPNDRHYLNVAGTSFAAPVVAGAVSLLKDLSYSGTHAGVATEVARDTRVIRSVLMAGAERTANWDNGQRLVEGVISTTQSLDYRTGAGALDLAAANAIYRGGTTDIAGLGGGAIATHGWDFGSVAEGVDNDYLFTNPFEEAFILTVSLNWFIDRAFDNELNLASDVSFVNLDLEVWSVSEGVLLEKVAQSYSEYNNSEFLRITLAAAGHYALRITFTDVIFDLSGVPPTAAEYALAWRAEAVPEPGSVLLIGLGAAGWLALRRYRGKKA